MKLTSGQKCLRKRIIEISYEAKFSHLGSCLTAVDIIDSVYGAKKRMSGLSYPAATLGLRFMWYCKNMA